MNNYTSLIYTSSQKGTSVSTSSPSPTPPSVLTNRRPDEEIRSGRKLHQQPQQQPHHQSTQRQQGRSNSGYMSTIMSPVTTIGDHRLKSPIHPQQMKYSLTDDQYQAYLDTFMQASGEPSNTIVKTINSDRSLSLPLEKHTTASLDKPYDNQDDELEISVRKYLSFGVQWVSLLTENLLSHPFVVLRRQCQVYNASKRYHLHPFGLIPTVIHLHHRQGVTTLWKGLGSCLMVRGLSMSIDDILSKITSWPKEVDSRTSLKRVGQHIILKSISIALVMPYYAASLVETVQSDIASEKPGMLDVFREGTLRLLYWKLPQKGRMLPIWVLIGPVVAIGLTKYLFNLVIRGTSTRIMRRRFQQSQEHKGLNKYRDDNLEQQNVAVYSNLVAMLTTEVIFYPFETIIHRIQLQGTRTIVDNLDNGYAVVPILTNYQGFIDCYRTTISTEGVIGLYKGFGAIILQFAAHVAVIRLTKWIVTKITDLMSNGPSSKIAQFYNIDPNVSNATSISPSLATSEGADYLDERNDVPEANSIH